jgi:hypothetical protein
MEKYSLPMIISGGQTGVDRAALDFALKKKICCSGWCPMGRKAEDGCIPDRYPLLQTNSSLYQHRTRKNVKDSDATLIIKSENCHSRGTALTLKLARMKFKPIITIVNTETDSIKKLIGWLNKYKPEVLNVAGPRGSENSEIYALAFTVLSKSIKKSKSKPPQWPPPKPDTADLFERIEAIKNS